MIGTNLSPKSCYSRPSSVPLASSASSLYKPADEPQMQKVWKHCFRLILLMEVCLLET